MVRDRRQTEIKTAWRLERDQSLCKECLCQHCLDLQYCHHFRIQQGSERKGTEYVHKECLYQHCPDVQLYHHCEG